MGRGSFVFAHLADAHVGAWARDAAVRRALRESVLGALRAVDERECEFLLVSGDLFHTPVPDPAEVAPIAAALRGLVDRGRRIYVIYGSHDYVAQRTSWLDVLAETGLFLKAAPEAVRVDGSRLTLPFLVDRPTGAAIAGISGRSHGLDRQYFSGLDTEALRAHDGFRIFQYHAAVEEYLPPNLREHVKGLRRDDLPAGLDYYAGGHIHLTYVGEGPGGGLLVNPGAVFGTSVTDIENGLAGRGHSGVAIVTVDGGRPSVEFVDTAPRGSLRVFDVALDGLSGEAARQVVAERVRAESAPGVLLFPRLHGTPVDASVGTLGIGRRDPELVPPEIGGIHWEIDPPTPAAGGPAISVDAEANLLGETLDRLLAETAEERSAAGWTIDAASLRELVAELGQPISDGESRLDYETARVDAALRALRVRGSPADQGADGA